MRNVKAMKYPTTDQSQTELCSTSKVFEKLILIWIFKIKEQNKTDFTG
jgi:hypothetical protein